MLFVLTPDPPHKRHRQIISADTRMALLEAAIQGESGFALSRVDLDRPGPHYVADTMPLLRREFPDRQLVYLIGGDSLHDLPNWQRVNDFLAACSALGVMRRPGDVIQLDELFAQLPGLEEKLEFIDAPLLEIASREIRERVAQGGHYRYYVPPAVYELIEKNGIYRV